MRAPPRLAERSPIHAHLDGSDVARLDHPGGRPILIDQIQTWCATATRVTIRPVIDLRHHLTSQTYAIPDRIREHLTLAHPVCVFPACTRASTRCDLDHRTPWPIGETTTDNLAPLCRRHHRLKTHTRWTYQPLPPQPDDTGPPRYLWTSPTGATHTSDLTPAPTPA